VVCASVSLCITGNLGSRTVSAYDDRVLMSTRPGAGKSAWRFLRLTNVFVSAISCSSTRFCAVIGTRGSRSAGGIGPAVVVTSAHPVRATSWHVGLLGTKRYEDVSIAELSCTSPTLCFATTNTGATGGGSLPDVIWSTDPGGGRSWNAMRPRGRIQLFPNTSTGQQSLICWDASRKAQRAACVAGDGNELMASRNATAGRNAWRAWSAGGFSAIQNISCPAVSMCVAIDDQGHILTTANPASGSWSSFQIKGVPVRTLTGIGAVRGEDVSCASVSMCVAVIEGTQGSSTTGYIVSSTNPLNGRAAWHVAKLPSVPGSSPLQAGPWSVSCPTTSFCIGVAAGFIITSANPTGNASAWHVLANTPPTSFPLLQLAQVDCPSASLCLAVGDYWPTGNIDEKGIFVSTNPRAGVSAWQLSDQIGSSLGWEAATSSISCGSISTCTVVGNRIPGSYNSPAQPSITMTTTNPASAAPVWSTTPLRPDFMLAEGAGASAVSCTSSGLCVAVGNGQSVATNGLGEVSSSNTTTTGNASWSTYQAGADIGPMTSVACLSSSLCLAGDATGNVSIGR
jgi:hypothetical protein